MRALREIEKQQVSFHLHSWSQLSDTPSPTALFNSSSTPARKLNALGLGLNHAHPSLMRPPSQRAKHSPSPWSATEDELLKIVVDRYAHNWSLIADAYNSDRRIRMQGESRTPWECHERWLTQFASDIPTARRGSVGIVGGGEEAAGPSVVEERSTPKPQEKEVTGMATRGLKRRAASMNMPPPNATPASAPQGESRKRRRHTYVIEAIRKTVKKRESHQKANGEQQLDRSLAVMTYRWRYSSKTCPSQCAAS